jgi:uncharacterized protein involved in response to NO
VSLLIFPTPVVARPPPGIALLRLGFRPFYLGAALVAVLAPLWWLGVLLAGAPLPSTLPPLLWHGHEMLYGFAAAVITGFLLTAGKAWTGLPTPRGPALAALVLLWLAGRAAMLGALGSHALLAAAVEAALLPVVALVLGRVLWRARNRRNAPLVGLLLVLSAANLVFHASVLGALALDPRLPLQAALGVIVMIECVMAGRVVPAFTIAATPGLVLSVPRGLVTAALLATALGLLAWLLGPQWSVLGGLSEAAPLSRLAGQPLGAEAGSTGTLPAWPAMLTAVLLGVAALLQAALWLHWRPGVTRGRPILWILHAAYAWIPIGLVLLALASLGVIAHSVGLHALAVGATGGLVIGMLTRTARGHTGRPLVVGRTELLAYALVMAAAVLRVFGPMLMPPAWAWWATGGAWSLAFALYLVVYTPWLCRTRADGLDG